jgi:NDP-sugar pyrophosphorylase family protein
MALVPNPQPDLYGGVRLDARGHVSGFSRRGSADPGLHFVGVQGVTRRAFADVEDGVPSESVSGVYPRLMRDRGRIRGWTTRATFEDIGTPATYLATCLARAAAEGGATIDAGATMEPGATVVRSVLWAGARIERGASVVDSIVAGPVIVRAGARYNRVLITPAGALLPEGSHTDEFVVAPIDGKDART